MASGELNDQYREELKKRGFRLTSQREVIIKTLIDNSGRHWSVNDLWELAQEEDPTIGIATVYRTVNLLAGLGLLNLVNMDEGFYRFELPGQQMHFHIYCRVCGKVLHMKDEKAKEAEIRRWIEEEGFHFLPQTLELAALCDECRKRVSEGEMGEPPFPGFRRGRMGGSGRGRGRRGNWRP
jgi:Fur family ferric uptake transcriptional regulator